MRAMLITWNGINLSCNFETNNRFRNVRCQNLSCCTSKIRNPTQTFGDILKCLQTKHAKNVCIGRDKFVFLPEKSIKSEI